MTSRPAVGLPVVELGGGAVSTPVLPEVWRIAGELADDSVASRIAEADPSVWGPAVDATDPRVGPGDASDGLGWPALARTSRPLVGQIDALREAFRVEGAARVLLVGDARWTRGAELLAACGPTVGSASGPMVGSASGPMVGSASGGLLTVLDTPDPGAVAHAVESDLDGTVLVILDPAGDSAWIAAVHELLAESIGEAVPEGSATRTVVLTEAGSVLDERARAAGSVVITTERDVPGPFSVLGAPGLVPAGLAGIDVGEVLDEARAVADLLAADDPSNPALELAGALVATAGDPLRVAEAPAPGLAGWVTELLAAAGGFPVPEDPADGVPEGPVLAPGVARQPEDTAEPLAPDAVVRTGGPLGAELLLWQIAAAAAARLLEADSFGPDAPASGSPGRATLECRGEVGGIGVYGGPGPADAAGALQALVDAVPVGGHVALSGWLDPADDASFAVLRGELARRTGLPVTFGWGPRDRAVLAPFRRDTPRPGVLCLLTGDAPDGSVPGPGPDLTSLALTEAAGVAADVAARGVPVLRLHLTDRVAGLVALARAVQGLRPPTGREHGPDKDGLEPRGGA